MATARRLRNALAALLIAALAGCAPAGDGAVTVSGKTVFGAMAVEEVTVEARPADPAAPPVVARSGYHGSFSLRLAPGRYRLVATGSLPGPDGGTTALGGDRPLEVPPGVRRVDRVVVELRRTP